MSWSYLVGPTSEDTPDLVRNTQLQQRVSNYTTQFMVDPSSVNTVDSLAKSYPNISPGLAWSLGSSGVGPGPVAEQAWQTDLASRLGREPGTQPRRTRTQDRKHRPRTENPLPGLSLDELREARRSYQQQVIATSHSDANALAIAREIDYEIARRIKDHPLSEQQDVLENVLAGRNELAGEIAKRPDRKFVGRFVETSIAQHEESKQPDWQKGGLENIPLIGKAVEGVSRVVAPISRTAALIGQAGAEAFMGGLRASTPPNPTPFGPNRLGSSASSANPEGDFGEQFLRPLEATVEQTTLGQAGKQLIETGEADVGSGFFPSLESTAAKNQAAAARKYSPYLIGGHAFTPGRATAQLVGFNPEDVTFDLVSGFIDGGVAWKMDPAAFALTGTSKARKAAATLVDDQRLEAGLIHGYRKTYNPTTVSEFLSKEKTTETVRKLGEDVTEPWDIVHGSGGKIQYYLPDGKPLAAPLADTRSGEEVLAIVDPLMRTEQLGPISYKVPKVKPRMFENVPERTLDLSMDADLNQAAATVDEFLAVGKAPIELRRQMGNLAARAGEGGPARYAFAKTAFESIAGLAKHYGASDEVATRFGTMMQDEFRGMVSYADDALGQPIINPYVAQVGKNGIPIPHPVFPDQFLNGKLTLPDPRELRRAVSKYKPLMDNPIYGGVEPVLDDLMSIWRRSVLIRPAFTVRINGEVQVRIATEGYAGMFNHPMEWASYVIGSPDNRHIDKLLASENNVKRAVGETAAAFKERVGRRPYLLGGLDPNDDIYMQGLNKAFGEIRSHGKTYLNDWQATRRGEPHYAEALAEQAALHHSRRLSRDALTLDPTDFKNSFAEGDLAKYREYMANNPGYETMAVQREAMDEHADVMLKTLSEFTQGNPKLTEAILDGTIDGIALQNRNGTINKRALEKFEELAASGAPLPDVVARRLRLGASEDSVHRGLERMDQGLNQLFDIVGTRPENYFARSPTLGQAYLDKWQDLFVHLQAKDRTKVLRQVDMANLKKSQTDWFYQVDERLAGREAIGQGLEHTLSYDSATMVAKHAAVKETKALLYDLSRRTQIFDMIRLLVPFGEAWKEILTTWGRLITENPQVIRRLDQLVYGGRSEESDAINIALGGTDMPGGFLHKNQFGTEVFTYTGLEFLTDKIPGMPGVPYAAPVSGLNMAGNIMPGIGPVGQLALAPLIPTTPKWEGLSKMLFPFGRPQGSLLSQVGEAFQPSWLKKFGLGSADPDNVREKGAAVIDSMKVLASTGDYTLQGDPAHVAKEWQRLLEDADKVATWTYWIRGAAQSALPSAPSPEWLVHDKKGRLTLLWQAAKWYQDRKDKLGGDSQAAYEDFLDKFGSKNFMVPQAKTKPVAQGTERLYSTAGSGWVAEHKDLVKKIPHVYPLFAPDSKDYDSQAYERLFASHAIEPLTPQEAGRAATARLASIVYDNALERVGTDISDEENQQLRALRRDLMEQFPGYGDTNPDYTKTPRLILELEQALREPAISRTPAAGALRKYLSKRQQVLDDQEQAGGVIGSVSTSQANSANRAWLREWGEHLSKRTKSFTPIWDAILSREVDDLEEEEG